MKYTRFLCVFCLIFGHIYQYEAVDFCRGFLDSLNFNDTHQLTYGLPNSFNHVEYRMYEQFPCHTGQDNHLIGCVLRRAGEDNIDVHWLHISTHSVINHKISITVEYPAPQRQLIFIISNLYKKNLYMDVSSIMNSQSRPTSKAFKKHRIILVGSRAHFSFEQWGAGQYFDVDYVNVSMPDAMQWSAPTSALLQSFAMHLTNQLRAHHIAPFTLPHWSAQPMFQSVFLSYCDARNIILKPSLATKISNHSSLGPTLDCSIAAIPDLLQFYEVSVGFHDTLKPSSQCSFRSAKSPSAVTPNQAENDDDGGLIVYVQFYSVYNKGSSQQSLLDSTGDFQLRINLFGGAVNQTTSALTKGTAATADLAPCVILLEMELLDKNKMHQVQVNNNNLHRPVIIEANAPVRVISTNPHQSVTVIQHKKRLEVRWAVAKYFANFTPRLEYYYSEQFEAPEHTYGPVLLKMNIVMDAFPVTFADVVDQSVRLICSTSGSVILKVNFSDFSFSEKALSFPSQFAAAPKSALHIYLGDMEEGRNEVPFSATNSLWILIENNIPIHSACGWKRKENDLYNSLTFVDNTGQRYRMYVSCDSEHVSVIDPIFRLQLETSRQVPTFSEMPEVAHNDTFLKDGEEIKAMIRVDSLDSFSNYDVRLTDCELVYQRMVADVSRTVSVLARHSLLAGSCPTSGFQFQRDFAGKSQKYFEFHMPPLPATIRAILANNSDGGGSSHSRSSLGDALTVHLSCYFTPCLEFISSTSPAVEMRSKNKSSLLVSFSICEKHKEPCPKFKENRGYIHVTSDFFFLFDNLANYNDDELAEKIWSGRGVHWCLIHSCPITVGLLLGASLLAFGLVLGVFLLRQRFHICMKSSVVTNEHLRTDPAYIPLNGPRENLLCHPCYIPEPQPPPLPPGSKHCSVLGLDPEDGYSRK